MQTELIISIENENVLNVYEHKCMQITSLKAINVSKQWLVLKKYVHKSFGQNKI